MTSTLSTLVILATIAIAWLLIEENKELITKWNRVSCKENWLVLAVISSIGSVYSVYLSYSEDNLKWLMSVLICTIGATVFFKIANDEDWFKNK